MYSEDKHIATRIDEITSSIVKSNAINPWELINKIYEKININEVINEIKKEL